MALGHRLDLRQTQGLVMTPQLRQAIKLLQCTNAEISTLIDAELERNPFLEHGVVAIDAPERPAPDQRAQDAPTDFISATGSGQIVADAPPASDAGDNSFDYGTSADGYGRGGSFDDDGDGFDQLAASAPSLREHIEQQIRLGFQDGTSRRIAMQLLAHLDPAGRLVADLDLLTTGLHVSRAQVDAVLATMQRFEPAGLFARDLRECLALQLEDIGRMDPYMDRLLDNLPLLARRDMAALRTACDVDAEDLAGMIADLRSLNPKPAAGFSFEPLRAEPPDVLMRVAQDGGWIIELNPETMPRVLVNHKFHARLKTAGKGDDKTFVAEQFAAANWLVRALQQRARTILRVATEIVQQQDAFFRHGVQWMKPLVLRDIAAALDLHESTVSRVTANKRIATPCGIFGLKYFFTTAINGTTDGLTHSAESVRFRIRSMIDAEPTTKILSDDTIVALLRREGVDIARRTVAKYREAMHIGSSVQRRREKSLTILN